VYGIRLSENARKRLAENTSISEDRKSGIITVTVTDRSPQRAAGMAGAYVEELDRLVAELTTSAAHRERVFIEERLKAVKQDLDAAAKEFSQFASKNAAIDIKEQGKAMVEAAATLQGHLIAAQSELKGLEQIFTDNNVRVRAVKARVGELQRQLEKLGGKETNASTGASQEAEPLYPSIRKLPLLGVTYADLYRRTKIQEVVYETLTQQYELAKVQEAKEIPTVKVLDAANVPEKKSFPPRPLIMFLGTFLSLAFGVVWVLGSTRWAEADPQDPRKVFAQEVLTTLKAQKPWGSQNGFRLRERASKVWSRFRRRQGQSETDKQAGSY
jgi:capsule polysaccharide export protein KpsE/RkpR